MKKNSKSGLRLKDLRVENDLFQKHVSDYLGCTQQTYSRYETGELEPSLAILSKLSVFYNTSVDYIIALTDDKRPYTRREQEKEAE
jgi:transcriptional regulator with XRE-family HTH domain